MNEVTQVWPWRGILIVAAEDDAGATVTMTVNAPYVPESPDEALGQMATALQVAASQDPLQRLTGCVERIERAAGRLEGAL